MLPEGGVPSFVRKKRLILPRELGMIDRRKGEMEPWI